MFKNILTATILLLAASPVSAEVLNFSGQGQYGLMSGQMDLDVVGGMAVSGTGYISGAGLVGQEMLTLITSSTPGSTQYPAGLGWRDGSGTDTWGYDNKLPMVGSDPTNGLVFSFGTSTVSWGHGDQFGIWNDGSGYEGWMSGPAGVVPNGGHSGEGPVNSAFYGTISNVSVGSAVPEPSTWAMMLVGFGGLMMFAGSKARRQTISIAG
jgi:hypothetical protein